MTFDITIPVLNEGPLERQVKTLHAFLKTHFPSENQWRIVVADNGSIDQTFEIASRLSAETPEITMVETRKE